MKIARDKLESGELHWKPVNIDSYPRSWDLGEWYIHKWMKNKLIRGWDRS